MKDRLLSALLALCMALLLLPGTALAADGTQATGDLLGNHSLETGGRTMRITIGTHEFHVLLEDNETVTALMAQLPQELEMSELNGNEKYNNLPFNLPTAAYAPGQIQVGDVMLYGTNCLVIFYESFSTSYHYTRIGRIMDPSNLREAVGIGEVRMSFSYNGNSDSSSGDSSTTTVSVKVDNVHVDTTSSPRILVIDLNIVIKRGDVQISSITRELRIALQS